MINNNIMEILDIFEVKPKQKDLIWTFAIQGK